MMKQKPPTPMQYLGMEFMNLLKQMSTLHDITGESLWVHLPVEPIDKSSGIKPMNVYWCPATGIIACGPLDKSERCIKVVTYLTGRGPQTKDTTKAMH